MAELRTVFEMVTTQIEPDLDAWSQLAEQHEQVARRRKVAALALVAVIMAAIALFASVALNRGRDGSLPAIPPGSRSAPTFTVVGVDGSVVASLPGFDGTATPDLSPDGTTVAFTIHDWAARGAQIATMRLDGTRFRILTNDPIAAKHPRWSPDGSQLLYYRTGVDGNLRLMVMDADGTNVREVSGTHQTADFNPADWSPDGSTILYTSWKDHSPILATLPIAGGRTHFLNPGTGLPEVGGAWSPDGSSIAFTRGVLTIDGGLTFEVWLMNADGNDEHLLASLEGASAEAPAWSPDGSKVAFIGTTSGIYRNGGVLYVIDVASGAVTEVSTGRRRPVATRTGRSGCRTAILCW
jgi:Tol biopolymer transport system component